jgi:hypothetical protein
MTKPRGLRRIAKLYGMVEEVRALQARASAAAVFEVERAVERLKEAEQEGIEMGRAGLERGSRVEAVSANASAVNDRERYKLLARLKVERQLAYEAAVELHRESRVELRQIEGLVERTRLKEDAETERRAQLASDDRFLSLREWMRARQASLSGGDM